MRKLNERTATPDEKESVIYAARWCIQHGFGFQGLTYDDPLVGPDGCHMVLFATPDVSAEVLHKALNEAYRERDVVKHEVVRCPAEWLEEARVKAGRTTAPGTSPSP